MRSLLHVFFAVGVLAACGQQPEVRIPGIPHSLSWENKPISHKFTDQTLTVVAGEKTDMFRDPNATYNTDNAPKLLFVADPDFVLSVSIEHAFESKWDAGCLVIKQDSLNWVKFCFEKDYTGANRVVSVVTKDISDDSNSVEMNADKVFYKIAKAGNVITLYYSIDAQKWFLVRHFQFDLKPGFRVGFLVQSPTGKQCEVKFGNIRYEKKKILDPYSGE
jgi:regulation of enolase protein 1 (concanavalin A-like superfamily)